MADFGRDLRSSDSLTGSRNFIFWPISYLQYSPEAQLDIKTMTVIIRTVQACADCWGCEHDAVTQKTATQIKRLIASPGFSSRNCACRFFISKIQRYLRACSQQQTRMMTTTMTVIRRFWRLLMLVILMMTMLSTATETARNLRRTSRQK